MPDPGSNRAHLPPGNGIGSVGRTILTGLRRGLSGDRSDEGYPRAALAAHRLELAKRRTFGRADMIALEQLLADAGDVWPVGRVFDQLERPQRLAVLRHDMDRDAENAVHFAEWEAAHGWPATYYVLHTDWYWRAPGEAAVSRFALRILERIASLGHEIGLHNNAITVGLLTGQDPVRILDRELTALRRAGFEVKGSAAHGDPICRVAGYVNDEIFLESTHRLAGESTRTIRYEDPKTHRRHEVTVRPIPMADLDLRYEASMVRNVHHRLSDTGGHWNVPIEGVDTRLCAEGGTLSLLVHPLWWAFGDEIVNPKTPLSVPALRRPG